MSFNPARLTLADAEILLELYEGNKLDNLEVINSPSFVQYRYDKIKEVWEKNKYTRSIVYMFWRRGNRILELKKIMEEKTLL